jgi:ribonuclease E
VTKKAAAEAAAATEGEAPLADTPAEAPAKPKRVTKKAAAEAAAATDPEATVDGETAPTKPKRTTKKAATEAPAEEVAS